VASSPAILPGVRLVRGADGSLAHQFLDSDGDEAAPPAGVLAVTVTRSDGSSVAVGAVTGAGSDPRAVTIAAAETANVDRLTATWTLDGTAIAVDEIDVVGGTIGSLAALKATDPTLRKENDATLRVKRAVVEDMALAVLGRSVVERFYVERVNGSGRQQLVLTWPDLRTVRWARTVSVGSFTAMTVDELAAIPADEAGIATRTDWGVWPVGWRNIELGYTFGMTDIPGDLLEALRKSVRHAITGFDTGVPTFAASMQTADGFNFGLAGPGNENWATGDIAIDRVVNRYRIPRKSIGAA
jgi:hypothetical protein